jgi:chromosome partitioning protein
MAMSIITIATSKGGAGKTTIAQIITGSCIDAGLSVGAIDSDLNQTFSTWVSNFSNYKVDVRSELNEANIVNLAALLEESNDVVVIDTAGAAMQATVFAIGCADLVLIPVQLSSADVIEAVKTKQLVDSASNMTKRNIETRVVLNDYQPNTNIANHTIDELQRANLQLLPTRLKRLVGFKEMTFNGVVPSERSAGEHVRRFMADLNSIGVIPASSQKLAS